MYICMSAIVKVSTYRLSKPRFLTAHLFLLAEFGHSVLLDTRLLSPVAFYIWILSPDNITVCSTLVSTYQSLASSYEIHRKASLCLRNTPITAFHP
ncbi:hypothetical protein BCR43DRAFT_492232 [Syncephalastrum racemosum]|uniref:Uncharacterized protein n=1 Tax=Syncephalastrum racemosum TaxID=13706 RepID=A0A1X2HD85_SYNRA|nr:hypothetical protein BCR43DRAFT_492232 [Syncephalastrum racemosum]